jgi:putative tryptophan/tyrosine transport system substrate-binding protein
MPGIGRRKLMAALGGALTWPVAGYGQKAVPVVGMQTAQRKLVERALSGLRKGLEEQGFVEGQTYRFEIWENNFQTERAPIMYREMVDQKVALIVTFTVLGLELAKAATQSIPIVFSIGADPVEAGFVSSLNKPGGNITGIFNLLIPMTGKRLEVFHELLPSVKTFAFLTDPATSKTYSSRQTKSIQTAADTLGLKLVYVSARTPDEIDSAYEAAIQGGAGGVITGTEALFFGGFPQLVAVAARHGLPTIHADNDLVKAGGLICYGVDLDEAMRLLGNYAGRILKGEKPADIPVQQTTKTKFSINLKTAKDLGITVPISLLGRADEVIE